MTRDAALYQFFNGAIPGVKAYPETNVPSKKNGDPEDAQLPYLTYPNPDAGFGQDVSFVVNIWFRTRSEALPNAAERTLYDLLGEGGHVVHYDDGAFWLKRGTPFSRPTQDSSDPLIKGRYINMSIEKLNA